jgi:hypothetical protein
MQFHTLAFRRVILPHLKVPQCRKHRMFEVDSFKIIILLGSTSTNNIQVVHVFRNQDSNCMLAAPRGEAVSRTRAQQRCLRVQSGTPGGTATATCDPEGHQVKDEPVPTP